MYTIYEDPIVKRKHDAQKMILEKANGKLSEYSKVSGQEAEMLRKQFPNKFPQASQSTVDHQNISL